MYEAQQHPPGYAIYYLLLDGTSASYMFLIHDRYSRRFLSLCGVTHWLFEAWHWLFAAFRRWTQQHSNIKLKVFTILLDERVGCLKPLRARMLYLRYRTHRGYVYADGSFHYFASDANLPVSGNVQFYPHCSQGCCSAPPACTLVPTPGRSARPA